MGKEQDEKDIQDRKNLFVFSGNHINLPLLSFPNHPYPVFIYDSARIAGILLTMSMLLSIPRSIYG